MERSRELVDSIVEVLSVLSRKIENLNSINLTDLSVHSERLFKEILNLVENLSLENINIEEPNAVSIDLGDKSEKFAIQVTATGSAAKVRKTFSKFTENKLHKKYDRLVVLVIGKEWTPSIEDLEHDGFSLSMKDDVWNLKTLSQKINGLNTAKLEELNRLLSIELPTLAQSRSSVPLGFTPSNLPTDGFPLIGREDVLSAIQDAYDLGKKRILQIVSVGGEGKTHIACQWRSLLRNDLGNNITVLDWSFNTDLHDSTSKTSLEFYQSIFEVLEINAAPETLSPWARATKLVQRLKQEHSFVLILDSIESLAYPPGPLQGKLRDQPLEGLLKGVTECENGFVVLTSRVELTCFPSNYVESIFLEGLSDDGGAELIQSMNLIGSRDEFRQMSKDYDGHALSLRIACGILQEKFGGDVRKRDQLLVQKPNMTKGTDNAIYRDTVPLYHGEETLTNRANAVVDQYLSWLQTKSDVTSTTTLQILRCGALFDRPFRLDQLHMLLEAKLPSVSDKLSADSFVQDKAIRRLKSIGVVSTVRSNDKQTAIRLHPMIHQMLYFRVQTEFGAAASRGHQVLFKQFRDSDTKAASIQDLLKLYQAIWHGCHAGQFNKCVEIFKKQLGENETWARHGLFPENLAMFSLFYDSKWESLKPGISFPSNSHVFNQTGLALKCLGRIEEAESAINQAISIRATSGHDESLVTNMQNLLECSLLSLKLSKAYNIGRKQKHIANRLTTGMLEFRVRDFPYAIEPIYGCLSLADVMTSIGRFDSVGVLLSEFRAKIKFYQNWNELVGGHMLYRLGRMMMERRLDKLFRMNPQSIQPSFVKQSAKELNFVHGLQKSYKGKLEGKHDYACHLLAEALPAFFVARASYKSQKFVGEYLKVARKHKTATLQLGRDKIEEALKAYRDIHMLDAIPGVLLMLFEVTRELNDFEMANECLEEAYEISKRCRLKSFELDCDLARCQMASVNDKPHAKHLLSALKLRVADSSEKFQTDEIATIWDGVTENDQTKFLVDGEKIRYDRNERFIDQLSSNLS